MRYHVRAWEWPCVDVPPLPYGAYQISGTNRRSICTVDERPLTLRGEWGLEREAGEPSPPVGMILVTRRQS
jgi:hypothetical protein